jgi:L-rhamnose isomerase
MSAENRAVVEHMIQCEITSKNIGSIALVSVARSGSSSPSESSFKV